MLAQVAGPLNQLQVRRLHKTSIMLRLCFASTFGPRQTVFEKLLHLVTSIQKTLTRKSQDECTALDLMISVTKKQCLSTAVADKDNYLVELTKFVFSKVQFVPTTQLS
jgi:hypothetical protein